MRGAHSTGEPWGAEAEQERGGDCSRAVEGRKPSPLWAWTRARGRSSASASWRDARGGVPRRGSPPSCPPASGELASRSPAAAPPGRTGRADPAPGRAPPPVPAARPRGAGQGRTGRAGRRVFTSVGVAQGGRLGRLGLLPLDGHHHLLLHALPPRRAGLHLLVRRQSQRRVVLVGEAFVGQGGLERRVGHGGGRRGPGVREPRGAARCGGAGGRAGGCGSAGAQRLPRAIE